MDSQSSHASAETLGGFGRIVAGIVFALLAAISSLAAAVGLTPSFSANSVGRIVFVVVFGAVGLVCAWFAYRLLANRPRTDGGLMGPVALRCTALFFIGLPLLSLATGAWKNNHIPLPVILIQGTLYLCWGVALWRLASARARMRTSRKAAGRAA